MKINQFMRDNAQALAVSTFFAVAIGGGYYYAPSDVEYVETIEVGWWNIRDLGDSRDAAEIGQIADVIRDLEVVMIGEVNNPNALRRIAEDLGPNWSWAATDEKIGRTSGSREYYGYLWDTDYVEMVGGVHVDTDPDDLIDREPAWATFRTYDDSLDFTVIGVHITWGDRVADRRAEIRALPAVWERVQAATADDDDLILVGDFNRNLGDVAFDDLMAIDGMFCVNLEPTKGDRLVTVVAGKSSYDQIFIDTDHTREWTGEYDVLDFDVTDFDDDDDAAKLAVSDHRPVLISLALPGEDDD